MIALHLRDSAQRIPPRPRYATAGNQLRPSATPPFASGLSEPRAEASNGRRTSTMSAYLNDDYSTVLSDDINIQFNFKDSTMRMLETFDDSVYQENINTDRLFLRKVTAVTSLLPETVLETLEDTLLLSVFKFTQFFICLLFFAGKA